MDFQAIITEIHNDVLRYLGRGEVANYIPALARVKPRQFGMAVCALDGQDPVTGQGKTRFSIQSVSKVFALVLAMRFEGESIWQRVGREPSGTPFNSLVQLEYEKGIPRNPFINAGALVITDIVMQYCDDANQLILDFVRKLARDDSIEYDQEIVRSEREAGYRNAALCNFLKSFGNIRNRVEDVLDVYYHQCALAMSCQELARAFLFLANGGVDPGDGEQIVTSSQAKRINAVMLTCGLYDEGGDFAFHVGLPGKSGVGGGIVAVMPGNHTVACWGPELNANHNSVCGMKALKWFTDKTGMSIF